MSGEIDRITSESFVVHAVLLARIGQLLDAGAMTQFSVSRDFGANKGAGAWVLSYPNGKVANSTEEVAA